MSEQHWPCRDRSQFDAFVAHVVETWDFAKPLLIKWSVGEKRSLGQNALIHVWIRHITLHMNLVSEFAAYIGCTLPMYGEYLELRGAA